MVLFNALLVIVCCFLSNMTKYIIQPYEEIYFFIYIIQRCNNNFQCKLCSLA